MNKFKLLATSRNQIASKLQEESEKGWELVTVLPDPYVSYTGFTQYTVVLRRVDEGI